MSPASAFSNVPLSAAGLAGLFEQHRRELQRFLTARCGSADDAEDLMQELWIKLQAQAGPVANGRAYLFRMANNLALDHARTRQRAMRRDRDWVDRDAPSPAIAEHAPDPAPTPEQVLATAQEGALVQAAIEALPPGARRALRLCRIDGLAQAEAARIMGISRSGIEKHLALALRQLRRHLSDCGLLPPAASGKIRADTGPAEPREPAS
ncbi:MAG: RNA polymerase sigma factor [Sphingomonadales bacterium]|nr:RNA polymerase sigma factor [Sphingomonadales bacterium]